jgi:signal transduction histidine kinase
MQTRAKLLLVDDVENNLFSMETVLGNNYHIIKARSGKEALKILLKDWDFTLILMDVEMPDLNGFEAAALIYEREKLRHIPIIFITAHNYSDERIFKGYASGAVDYIYKPVQPELLRAKVGVFVELYKKNHQLLAQEQKLIAINRSLENEIKDRISSEEKVTELNKKLLDNVNRLETANKELDHFAYMASHDLQEPLRKMRMFSDRLSINYADLPDNENKAYITKIQAACSRMQALINDILAFTKISVTRESLIYCNLNILVEEVLNDLDVKIRKKNAKVFVDKLPKLHVHPGLMKPLFQNLIDNSLKYSKLNEEPVIRITSRFDSMADFSSRTLKDKYCRISVQDNGIGFDQQYAEQIFNMFKRLHLNSEYEGTGIGLAICKKIVEEHQGFIFAKGKVNEGSTFIVSLPAGITA